MPMPPLRKTEPVSENRPSRLAASFRDPSGFLFEAHGVLYRQVNESYREHLELLDSSGLYQELVRMRQAASTADFILIDGRP